MGERLANSQLSCSKWAEKNRVLKSGPFRFDEFAFLRPVHDVQEQYKIIPKGSQLGFTETAMDIVLHGMEVMGLDCMYLLPTESEASDFSASRFNPAIEMSDSLKDFFTSTDNVGHKRAGLINLFVRGTQSRSKLKSVPVDLIVKDERDEMNKDNVDLADERMAASQHKIKVDLSTPTIPGYGIWLSWMKSQQNRWHVKCPHCKHHQYPEFDLNLEWIDGKPKTARYKCARCKKPWTHEEKVHAVATGQVVKETAQGEGWGYHVSQLHSPRITAVEMITKYEAAVTSGSMEKMAVFVNSARGEPYTVDGSKLTDEIMMRCMIDRNAQFLSHSATMGVDVTPDGRHYAEIAEWINGIKFVIQLERPTWGELAVLMDQYKIRLCVIDAHPEDTKSREFCEAFQGRALRAYYPEGMKDLFTPEDPLENNDSNKINIHRTDAFDTICGKFKTKKTYLARELQHFEQYKTHLCNIVRVYKDVKGNKRAFYVETGSDHFAHAALYNHVAGTISPDAWCSAEDEIYDPEEAGVFSL